MKVLELVLKWGSGGVERYIEDLVSASSSIEGVMCSVASVTTEVSSRVVEGQGPLVVGGLKGVLTKGHVIRSFIAEGAFDVVHIHGNNGLAFFFAHQAARAGAKAIVHSHNSSFGPGSVAAKKVLSGAMRFLYMKDCSALLACSQAAGVFLFDGTPYKIAKNGIDVARFGFNPEIRKNKRTELGIPDRSLVCGFAASLIDAKNPMFALDVFRAVKAHRADAVFLVCGDGCLLEPLKEVASDLTGSCIFKGRVSNIEDYYSVMDVLIAPSRYEGLPINLIEAQASGLPVIMSDSITDEVVIVPGNCRRCGLSSSVDAWASNAIGLELTSDCRAFESAHWAESIRSAGFSQPDCFDVVFAEYKALR